ncbi:hypothetical protein [Microlunatus parietis]|uniref:Uncharacterized protein n=1 Tax=Microlunatus parietis TaxID=682979 RepID=A0A7Y9LCP9_9ACTN|nr:hypothetical protein [Microlunatus parietis]NYE72058.1 hypothetical protein [Microlunatus parietis]
MADQNVVWTVVPKGAGAGRVHFSIFVRPRLTGGATLADFEHWMSWPEQNVKFFITLDGGAEIEARAEGPDRRPDLWAKLFPPSTPVDAPDAVSVQALAAAGVPKVRSAPTGAVRTFIKQQYQIAGARFTTDPPGYYAYEEPGGDGLAPQNGGGFPFGVLDLHRVALLPGDKEKIRNRIRTELDQHGYFLGGELTIDGTTYSAAAVNFLLVEQFHRRRRADNHAGQTPPKVRVLADPGDQLDFHSVVGHLGAYPAVLRRLGLVRDISIPLPAGLPATPVAVRVRADWAGAGPNDDYTTTLCEISADRCSAAPAPDSVISDGLLRLDEPPFQLVEIDSDAIANKVLGFAQSVQATPRNSPEPLAPPSTEATGLALHRTDKAKILYQTLGKVAGMQSRLQTRALADEPLHAEDLLRGYRLDVWDDATGTWHSLCRRKGSYTFDDVTITLDDEGMIESAHTEQSDDDTVYLHESMARWVGYSLVAPRPGLGTAGDDDSELAGPDSDPDERFKLKTSFTATKGSLPKLRYGRTYRLRARAVDIAGNSRNLGDFADDDFTAATEAVRYHRFEPVAPPNLLLRRPRTEGESPELMVIRSNYDTAAKSDSQRHVVPNKTAQLTAEQHGMFDTNPNILNPSSMSKAAYALIKERDPATLADRGEPDPSGHDLRYYDTDQLKVPYLPDVLARGAAFAGLPGTDDVVTVDFDFALLHRWPDARPFRLRLLEGTGAPTWAASSRLLTVRLPKGRAATVRYSCRIDAGDRELLGLWNWLMEYAADHDYSEERIAELESLATKGRLWQLTPYRTLSLVHAVRQPNTPPAFTKPVAVRRIGDTFAKITDKITADRPSTSKIDLVARWTEPVDLLSEPGPREITGSDHAFDVKLDPREDDAGPVVLDQQHELHDTLRRVINYELIASTRFAEYFTERKRTTLTAGTDTKISTAGIVPGSDVITSTDGPRKTYARNVDYTIDYAAGTVRPTDAFTGGTVEVAFVAPPITRSSTETKPAAVVDIPSSARPRIPEIAYLLPTFGWQNTKSGDTITSKRLGHGLRVFLHRPWYSSGVGEQLAVVLLRQLPPADPTARQQLFDRLGRYVTTWGLDPAFATQSPAEPLQTVPLVSDFPLAQRPKTKIILAEADSDQTLRDQFVAVAPHEVHYDKQRRLWFADITLTATPAYMPFIRLALARYQPRSISKVELSTVALAQFAQLNPDRTLTVTGPATASQLAVTVAGGRAYAPKSGYTKPARVEALVQTANPALSGELAWTTVGNPIPLTAGGSPGTWSGNVTLPAPRGSQPFRLVIKEFEVPELGDDRRLVYADTVQL